MKKKDYELSYNGSNGDCTSSYKVIFNREYKVEEFVKSILTNKEFGCIKIKGISVRYDSNLSSCALAKFYDKKIKKCYASGGWGRMDYDIEIDEEIEPAIEVEKMSKTPLEHFQDIKELEVADGPEVTVNDLLPYKCEQVEKSLKALEIIKEKNVDIRWIEVCDTVKDYNKGRDEHLNHELTEEEFNTLKEGLE